MSFSFLSKCPYFFSCHWRLYSSVFVRCRWCLLPCSLVLGSGFCGPSASFGSPVLFAMWSPFGTSQGWLFPLYRSVLWFLPRIRLLLGRLSVQFSCDSLESAVPLATWSPLGMRQDFARSLFHFPFWWGMTLVRVLFACLFCLFSLFPWCLFAFSGVGLLSVFPFHVVSVPAHLLILSICAALFLASVFSSLRPLHPAFRFFLVCVLAVFFFFTFAASFRSQFIHDGVALWDESLIRLDLSPSYLGLFVSLCVLRSGFVFVLCPFSLPPPSWASARSSSLPLMCGVFWCVVCLGCVHHGSLSSCLGSFLRLCLSCSFSLCVLYSFSEFGGGSLWFFLWFPLWFSFHNFGLASFPTLLCCSFVSVPFSFSLGVSDLWGEGSPASRRWSSSVIIAVAPVWLSDLALFCSGSLPSRPLCLW